MKRFILAFAVSAICFQSGAQSAAPGKYWYKVRAGSAHPSPDPNPGNIYDASSRANTICLLDSDYTRSWYAGMWGNYSRRVYHYDNNSNCITQVHAYQSGTSWNTSMRHKRTFDASNNMTADVTEYFSAPNSWFASQRTLITYTTNHNPLSTTNESWNAQQNNWNVFSTSASTYDQNNHESSYEYYQLNPTTSTISSGYRSTYTNTASGDIIDEIDQHWEVNSNAWVNDARIKYDFDIFGSVLSGTLQQWTGSAWENDQRAFFTYNGNKQFASIVVDSWNSQTNQWIKDFKETYTYNAVKDLTQLLDQYWDGQANVWENDSRIVYTYDSNHHELTRNHETWELGAWTPATSSSSQYDNYGNQVYNQQTSCIGPTFTCQPLFEINSYFNCTTVGVNEPVSKAGTVRVFPNPASGFVQVEPSLGWVTIMDLTGNLVKSQSAGGEVDISQLPKGLYILYFLVDGQPPSVVKLVKD
jgi:hypothetical protein